MLKIKDNIDLKELEKFGYKRQGGKEEEHYHWGYYTKKIFKLFSDDIVIVIPFRNEDERYIFVRYYNDLKEDFETRIYHPKLKKKIYQRFNKNKLSRESR